jgi:hypothetical protein
MGVIMDYAKMRLEDARREAESFLRNPVKYTLDKQIIRKAILLEYLDNVRPIVGTRYEHWIEEAVKRAERK